jgi:hypothetical protein
MTWRGARPLCYESHISLFLHFGVRRSFRSSLIFPGSVWPFSCFILPAAFFVFWPSGGACWAYQNKLGHYGRHLAPWHDITISIFQGPNKKFDVRSAFFPSLADSHIQIVRLSPFGSQWNWLNRIKIRNRLNEGEQSAVTEKTIRQRAGPFKFCDACQSTGNVPWLTILWPGAQVKRKWKRRRLQPTRQLR